jgi:hypothetical protein
MRRNQLNLIKNKVRSNYIKPDSNLDTLIKTLMTMLKTKSKSNTKQNNQKKLWCGINAKFYNYIYT